MMSFQLKTMSFRVVRYRHITLAVLLSCALVNRSLRSGEKDATLSFSASRRKVTLSKYATNLALREKKVQKDLENLAKFS